MKKKDSVELDAAAQARLGAVGKLADGRSYVKFVRHLPHTIERVWSAFVDQAQRDVWFPGFSIELRQGGQFEIWFGGDCDGPAHVSGTVVEFEPPTVLQCGGMRWELEDQGDGTCTVTFTDVLRFGGTRSSTDITNAVLAGWHHSLDLLTDWLAGRAVDVNQLEFDYSTVDIAGRD